MGRSKIGRHGTRVTTTEGVTKVRYWGTDVVTIDRNHNTVTLDTGGWFSMTTKKRMNQASEEFGLGYRVFQEKFDWFVSMTDINEPIIYNYKTESFHPYGNTFRFSLDKV